MLHTAELNAVALELLLKRRGRAVQPINARRTQHSVAIGDLLPLPLDLARLVREY